MAQRPSVVTAEVTSVPDPTEIARVADFVREPFVEEGEDAAAVLAPGSIRRHAFEAARAELNAGAEVPSQKWRRRWSLLLGLDRTLNATTPVLADGTTLNPHQVDALSGTYAALLADAQRRASGGSGSDGDALLLSFEDEDPTELEEPPAEVATADDEGHHDDGASGDDEDGEDDDLESLDEQLVELPDAEPESESSLYDDVADEDVDEDIDRIALDDPNAHKRFWFEHATGAGKTVAAMGFVEACRTGGILILTHRRNLVDQFQDELRTRGYGERLSKPLLTDADGGDPNPDVLGPVTIETYQWFVRNAGRISGAYTVVICDEAHTALGDKTSAAIRAWTGPIFIGMTATGALIARHVADLFPTQTSRFDLAQAARRGVIAPLRCLRIPPGPGVRTIAKVPLRKGEVDMEFDQEELAKLLDQAPFNLAIADLYKTRFRNTPGVVYAAGVEHAYNVAESFRALGMKAQAVSGETPKRELANILAEYDAGNIDVLINAQLLAEGWNSPRATICMHLAPTASKRIYQQRVGRVTRRHPGKEAGVVIDFVHPATPNDDPVVTLHSLLDRDVYRGGAIVVGPVRRGRGRRVKVERRVLPVTPNIERRRQVFERELWRIAVEQLDWGEQRVWAALAGAKASPSNWRRGRAMLNFDRSGELRRQFLITALERNRSPQLRMRAIQEIALLREAEPFDTAIDFIGQWPRDERREASRTMLQAMADRRIGRRDQATAWIWRLAEYTRDVHEEYAAQRWPATKHLLGLLVNSSGAAHARNARRLVHGARQHDRRLQAALLAAAVAHTPEAEEVLREARTRLARKPGALSRDLLKDFPNGKRRKKRSRKRRGGNGAANGDEATTSVATDGTTTDTEAAENGATEENGNGNNGNGNAQNGNGGSSRSRRGRSRGGRRRNRGGAANVEATPQDQATPQDESAAQGESAPQDEAPPAVDGQAEVASATNESSPVPGSEPDVPVASEDAPPTRRRRMRGQKAADAASAMTPETGASESPADASSDAEPSAEAGTESKPAPRRTRTRKTAAQRATEAAAAEAETAATPPVDAATPAVEPASVEVSAAPAEVPAAEAPAEKPVRRTRTRKTAAEKAAEAAAAEAPAASAEAPVEKPVRPTRTRKTAAQKAAEAAEAEAAAVPVVEAAPTEAPVEKPVRATRTRKTAAQKAAEAEATPTAKPAARRTTTRKTAAQKAAEVEAASADEATPAAKPAARRTTTRKTAAQKAAEVAAAEVSTASEETPTEKPVRATRTRKTAAQKAAEAGEAPATDDATPATKPAARKPATRKTAAQKAAEAAAADGVEDVPAKKPAARRATTATKTTAATKAAPKKPATRKTAAQKAAEAAAETATDAPAKKPAARKTTAAAKTTTTRKTAAAKTTTTAAKKPAARKPTKTTATKATAAPKTTTRRKATPTPEED